MTRRFLKMCEVYKIFASSWDCDFSKEAMQEMFEFESFGKGNIEINGFNTTGKKPNGYAVGKKWLNVNVSMWMEEINRYGWLTVLSRLYADEAFPKWWLDEVFSKIINDKKEFWSGRSYEKDILQLCNTLGK